MPNSYYSIGATPKNNRMLGGGASFLDHKKPYLSVAITPMMINDKDLNETFDTATGGQLAPKPSQEELFKRAKKLGAEFSEGNSGCDLLLHCVLEGAISEQISNNLDNVSLSGKLAQAVQSSGLSTIMRSVKNEYGDNYNDIIANSLNGLGDYMGIGEDTKPFINALNDAIKNFKSHKSSNIKELLNNHGVTGAAADKLSKTASMILNTALGNRVVMPKVWDDSSYSATYSFKVRLYNPNPASQKLHRSCILNPLFLLQALALPNGDEDGNLTYEAPLYVQARSEGLFEMRLGMVTSLNIVKGGDENAIAFNGRPSYVDVTLQLSPLYDKKMISDNGDNLTNERINNIALGADAIKNNDTNAQTDSGTQTGLNTSETIDASDDPGSRSKTPDPVKEQYSGTLTTSSAA